MPQHSTCSLVKRAASPHSNRARERFLKRHREIPRIERPSSVRETISKDTMHSQFALSFHTLSTYKTTKQNGSLTMSTRLGLHCEPILLSSLFKKSEFRGPYTRQCSSLMSLLFYWARRPSLQTEDRLLRPALNVAPEMRVKVNSLVRVSIESARQLK